MRVYKSFKEIDNDLAIRKLERDIALEKVKLNVTKTKDELNPIKLVSGFKGILIKYLIRYIVKKFV
ncbi:hypothetical protein NBRC110019_19620 [Neptunitalea chrysea]|uniref:Glutaminyl-tRNA synthetase n=1 Tax=Neptunitalea chrysea TaxID=1647581 RepID=A0A9W6B6W5_9FLAO|nr:DUF6327 family protein [Neptunitalea chrysea]GLB52922.1 hypothetical protein NBRC110019_19620 [Neptunitalea chrysea]